MNKETWRLQRLIDGRPVQQWTRDTIEDASDVACAIEFEEVAPTPDRVEVDTDPTPVQVQADPRPVVVVPCPYCGNTGAHCCEFAPAVGGEG